MGIVPERSQCLELINLPWEDGTDFVRCCYNETVALRDDCPGASLAVGDSCLSIHGPDLIRNYTMFEAER